MYESESDSFFEFNGSKIYYETFGSGPKTVLLIPGAIGTARTDFQEMVDGEDELDFDKFTVIAVEAPGWGRSRPPLRNFGLNVYNNDCECFHALMQYLGYNKYSVIGWCEGSKVALLMAMRYRGEVNSLVLSSFSTMISNKGILSILQTKSVETWSKKKVDPYLKVYKTKDELQKLWTRFIRFREHYNQYFPEDIFKNKYHLVKCPVLLIHGDQDPFIEIEQPLSVYEQLNNVKLHRFPKGEHDCQLKYSAQFTRLVQDHLLNKNGYTKNGDEQIDIEMDQLMNNRIQL